MTWRSFHIFIMFWFALNIIVRFSNEVFIWVTLSAVYYVSWQYSIIFYRATHSYVNYLMGNENMPKLDENRITFEEQEEIQLKELRELRSKVVG